MIPTELAPEPTTPDPLTLAAAALDRAVASARAARAAEEAEGLAEAEAEAALVAARAAYRAAREVALAADGYTAIYTATKNS